MRDDGDRMRPIFEQIFNSWERALDASGVGDSSVFKWHVEISSEEHTFVLKKSGDLGES